MEAIKKIQVSLYTNKYRSSHRREPKGRGCWAFSCKRNPDFAPNSSEVMWYTGTYAETRKQAIAEAAAHGQCVIFVQP